MWLSLLCCDQCSTSMSAKRKLTKISTFWLFSKSSQWTDTTKWSRYGVFPLRRGANIRIFQILKDFLAVTDHTHKGKKISQNRRDTSGSFARSHLLLILLNGISCGPSTLPIESMSKPRLYGIPGCCSCHLSSTKDTSVGYVWRLD